MSCKPAWASSLKQVGLYYYAGIVDDGEEILEAHKIATQSCFGTQTSAKKSSVSHTTTEKDTTELSKTCKVSHKHMEVSNT